MPCVGFQRPAFHFTVAGLGDSEEHLLHDDDKNQNAQSKDSGRRAVRRAVKNFPQTVQRDHGASGQEDQRSANTGEGFHFPMAIGVLRIRRTLRILQGEPDECRAEDIQSRFESIGNQGIRVPQPTCRHFHHSEQEINEHASEQNGAAAGSSLGDCGHSKALFLSACGRA